MAFKLCLIGCGRMAFNYHGPVLQRYAAANPDVDLAACSSRDATKAVEFAGRFGFSRHYTDLREMLSAEKPDGVCVTVAEAAMAATVCEVMLAGFPVLMEKPPGLNGDEARRVAAAARRSGQPNRVAFNRRHIPLVAELKTRMAALPLEALPIYLRFDLSRAWRTEPDFSISAIHGLDAARHIVGSPYAAIRFDYMKYPGVGAFARQVVMQARFDNGAQACVCLLPQAGCDRETAVVTAPGETIELDMPLWYDPALRGELRHFRPNRPIERIVSPPGGDFLEENGFYAEHASFWDALRAGRRDIDDAADSVQSVDLMVCLREKKISYRKRTAG